MEGMAPPVRHAARVVLLDPQARVLLMRYDDPPPNGTNWSTPGGGLEPGESHHEAALRELAEETGWTDIELQRAVHRQIRTPQWRSGLIRPEAGDG